jgi:hypothetical protein
MAAKESTTTSTRVAQAADVTREQATQVVGTAKDQAQDLAQQAAQQAKSTVRQLQGDLRERADQEASKFAETVRSASEQMRSMATSAGGEQRSLITNLMSEGAQVADRFASQLDEGGVERAVAEVRSWARRNPGGFLLGAAVAGFVAGRLARNLSSANGTSDSATPSPYGEATDAVGPRETAALGRASQDLAPTGLGARE